MEETRAKRPADLPAAAEELRLGLRGSLVLPEDDAYDDTRAVWNGMVDRYPSAIVRAAGVGDVVAAVNFVAEHDLPVSVRGGGHNVAGTAVCDDGVVIDLRDIDWVRVDPNARRVRVGGGATWADIDWETQVFELATPGGEVSETGVAGLTLGGGVGQLRRKYGLSCDALRSIDVVTADGEFLTASEDDHEELFWALRGGGGNFGVVTAFEFELHPVGPEVLQVTTAYDLEEAEAVIRAWREYTETAPDEVSSMVAIWGVPRLPELPTEAHDDPVVLASGLYAGSQEEAAAALKPLQELAEPAMDLSARMPYVVAQSALDAAVPEGDRYYWKSINVEALTDEFVDRMAEHGRERPHPRVLMILRHMGGAIADVDELATAYSHRDVEYMLSIDGIWEEPADDDTNVAWVRETWADLRGLTAGGVYLNFPGFGEDGEALARAVYGDETYDRLASVKATYDPGNRFRSNVNVEPATH
ncbi:FAD-binding oxidoreductase [Natrononativus amylolyticus]|uniref:FAD-binding oxidoreductase n=1 Tax=Natrononativus amylolyticus TaxID=2963434 RepID=UPI0020CD77CE|nr:FAD-binding oxidoreductase [Natrononativus amylolyticus]